MSTFMAKPESIQRKWFIIDAEGKTLGKVAVLAATILNGKHTPAYIASRSTAATVSSSSTRPRSSSPAKSSTRKSTTVIPATSAASSRSNTAR